MDRYRQKRTILNVPRAQVLKDRPDRAYRPPSDAGYNLLVYHPPGSNFSLCIFVNGKPDESDMYWVKQGEVEDFLPDFLSSVSRKDVSHGQDFIVSQKDRVKEPRHAKNLLDLLAHEARNSYMLVGGLINRMLSRDEGLAEEYGFLVEELGAIEYILHSENFRRWGMSGAYNPLWDELKMLSDDVKAGVHDLVKDTRGVPDYLSLISEEAERLSSWITVFNYVSTEPCLQSAARKLLGSKAGECKDLEGMHFLLKVLFFDACGGFSDKRFRSMDAGKREEAVHYLSDIVASGAKEEVVNRAAEELKTIHDSLFRPE